jgi:hypothetical protein
VDVTKCMVGVVVAAITTKNNGIRERSETFDLRTDAALRHAAVDRPGPGMLASHHRWRSGS